MNPNVMQEAEAAKYIGMSSSWLRQSRFTGNPEAPPFIKIGRSVRYLLADLNQWLSDRRQRNTLESEVQRAK
jgi:predicted DNA-binding transcriptional regulator AlpA